MKEFLVIEIDAIPFTLSHWQIMDYNGALIADLLYERPSHGSSENAIGFNAKQSIPGQGKDWIVSITTDLHWENSDKLTAQHIFDGYQYSFKRKKRTPLLSIFKLIDYTKGVNGIQLEKENEFSIFFKTDMPCIEKILSSLIFVPVKYHGEQAVPFPGKYHLSGSSSESITLTRNKNRSSNRLHEHIIFLKTQNSRQGVKLFNKGIIDITANTSFPFKEIPKHSKTGNLSSTTMKLTTQLECNHKKIPALGCKIIKNQLYRAIDKVAISAALNNSIIPFEHYTALWNKNWQDKNPQELLINQNQNFTINTLQNCKISFADYAPNFNIVSIIINQIKKQTGVQFYPEALSLDAYVKKYISGDYDMMYTITSCHYDDPLCFVSSLCSSASLEEQNPKLYELVNIKLASANAMQAPDARFQEYHEIEHILFNSKHYMPLFAVKSYNLTNPKLKKSIRYNTMGKLIFNES